MESYVLHGDELGADRLGGKWVGIDRSPKAIELVNIRLQQAMGSLFHHGYVAARTDIPQRTDIEAPVSCRQNRNVIFGQQEDFCNGCLTEFPFRIFEVDPVTPHTRTIGRTFEHSFPLLKPTNSGRLSIPKSESRQARPQGPRTARGYTMTAEH